MKAREKQSISVAITSLNSSQTPSPGIGIVHSLKGGHQGRISIIAFAYDMFSDGIHALPLADEIFEVPFPQNQPQQFLKRIAALVEKVPIQCLVPTIDAEVAAIARMQGELERLGIRVFLPGEDSLKAISKESLVASGPFKLFSLPPSAILHSRSDLPQLARTLGFPLMIKGPLGEALQAGSLTEAGVYFDMLARTWGTPLILQRAIPGEEYAVACLADREHAPVGIVAMKKIIQDDGGTTWAGVTVQEDDLLVTARYLLDTFQWVGPLEMEFIKEAASGRFYLIEINNRFPAWIHLATRAGQNLPLAYVQLALGKKVKPFEGYRSGMLYVRVADDLVTDLSSLAGIMTKGEWHCHEKNQKRSLRKTHHRP